MATPVQHFVDEILEEIFLRLPTPAALARTSTACPRFRRIITERSFLRRFRKRHPPPLLGFADKDGFHPAEAPHPSAPLARALAAAADFTYSFVPKPTKGRWMPCDGRVLLEVDSPGSICLTILAVCDPISRRYQLLPPIPEDLVAAPGERPCGIVPILAPTGDDEDEMSFKVIGFGACESNLLAFVFSSLTGQWCIAASPTWSSLGTMRPVSARNLSLFGCRGLSCFDYVHGCLYSASPWMDKLLVLDTRTMEFSTINDHTGYHMHLRFLPGQSQEVLARNDKPYRKRPGQNRSLPRIVVGREGALEMFSLVGDHSPNGSFDLYHTCRQTNNHESPKEWHLNHESPKEWHLNHESPKEWHLENIIPLAGQYDYFTLGAAEGFLFLGATTEDQLDIDEDSPERLWNTDWDVDYFSLDVRTSELAKVCRRRSQFFHYEDVQWYFGFPPSLSNPTL